MLRGRAHDGAGPDARTLFDAMIVQPSLPPRKLRQKTLERLPDQADAPQVTSDVVDHAVILTDYL